MLAALLCSADDHLNYAARAEQCDLGMEEERSWAEGLTSHRLFGI